MPLSNKYKNALNGLRKNNSSAMTIHSAAKSSKNNSYACLDNLDDILDEFQSDVSEPVECADAPKKNVGLLDCLPEEMINNILEYLPKNTRLAILKNKYNKKIVQNKLEQIPQSYDFLSKLYKCASIAKEVIEYALEDSDILESLPTHTIKYFEEEKDHSKYARYYKEKFTEIIMGAVKHYTKIYKMKPEKTPYAGNPPYQIYDGYYIMIQRYGRTIEWNKKASEKMLWEKKAIEEMMFRLYAHLTLI